MKNKMKKLDVGREMNMLQDNIDLFMDEVFPPTMKDFLATPITDVYVDGDLLHIETHLPNIRLEDINIEQRGQELYITAERDKTSSDHRKYVRRESSWKYSRAITLPVGATTEGADATFDHGILKITVPLPGSFRATQLKVHATNDAKT